MSNTKLVTDNTTKRKSILIFSFAYCSSCSLCQQKTWVHRSYVMMRNDAYLVPSIVADFSPQARARIMKFQPSVCLSPLLQCAMNPITDRARLFGQPHSYQRMQWQACRVLYSFSSRLAMLDSLPGNLLAKQHRVSLRSHRNAANLSLNGGKKTISIKKPKKKTKMRSFAYILPDHNRWLAFWYSSVIIVSLIPPATISPRYGIWSRSCGLLF